MGLGLGWGGGCFRMNLHVDSKQKRMRLWKRTMLDVTLSDMAGGRTEVTCDVTLFALTG